VFVAAVLVAAPSSGGPLTEASPPTLMGASGSLKAYARLAEGYREGRTGVIHELIAWSRPEVERVVRELRWRDEFPLRTAEAAAMMEVHATIVVLRGRNRADANVHALAAMDVLEWAHARSLKLKESADPHHTLRLDRATFYAGFAAGTQALAGIAIADEVAQAGLARIPDDPKLLYVAGCAREALALLLEKNRRTGRARTARDEAEHLLRKALEASPENTDCRLRLGRVLLEKDLLPEAAAILEPVAREGPNARLRHLGWLFLGRVREREGRWEAARDAYLRALREQPDGAAARIAFAYAIERLSGAASVQPLISTSLAGSTAVDEPNDPWLGYVFGPHELAATLLDALDQQLRLP
jgi:hypothetical protein